MCKRFVTAAQKMVYPGKSSLG